MNNSGEWANRDWPALSILTPSIPERVQRMTGLSATLRRQIEGTDPVVVDNLPVEHLVLIDNCRRSVGRKRDDLLRIARGDYVAYVDDDDSVSEDYVSKLLTAIKDKPDVITFLQRAIIQGQSGLVEFRLGNPNEKFNPDGITKRNAWHVCAWRRTLAVSSWFPDTNYGEDWAYADRLCALPNLKEVHIPSELHFYTYDSKVSRALPGRKSEG